MPVNTWTQASNEIQHCLDTGIREFVICAGARNAAMVEALAQAESAGAVRLWRHFEERSAGFFALGRTMETGQPCAVVTTSGTAAAELLPAIIEAHYQTRPLVAITADRPAAQRSCGAPQAIHQPGLFGPYVWQNDRDSWDGHGPLHVNVELDEDFAPCPHSFRQPASFTPSHPKANVAGLARWLRSDLSRGLVVMLGGLDPDEQEDAYHFCLDLGAPVVADANSGLREALQSLAIIDADRVLIANPPGKILRLGEVPSGRFWRDLESLPNVAVWSVCRNGLPGMARPSDLTQGRLDRVLPALGEIEPVDDAIDLCAGAARRAATIQELLETYPDSEPALIHTLSHYATLGSGVYLGNSLPIREWNLFAQWSRPLRCVRANRGANGIDGQLSTWLGCSADLGDAWALVGDLTALYDLAAPFMLGQVTPHGRVLAVINNRGGRIFERLPRLETLSPRAKECLTNPHDAQLAGWAALWQLTHLTVQRADDLDALDVATHPVLLEIIPNPTQTAQFWAAWDRMTP